MGMRSQKANGSTVRAILIECNGASPALHTDVPEPSISVEKAKTCVLLRILNRQEDAEVYVKRHSDEENIGGKPEAGAGPKRESWSCKALEERTLHD
jgi:hypothetical protein